MQLTSPAFDEGGIIPSKYTCEGSNLSPPLDISDVPKKAVSLVLIMDDPDVPKNLRKDGMWDHWVVYNIPPSTHHIAEGTQPQGTPGKTTFGHNRYGGPCPPDREHRYFLKLYALDAKLNLKSGATKAEVMSAMEGHVIAESVLMGRYEKDKGY